MRECVNTLVGGWLYHEMQAQNYGKSDDLTKNNIGKSDIIRIFAVGKSDNIMLKRRLIVVCHDNVSASNNVCYLPIYMVAFLVKEIMDDILYSVDMSGIQ